MAVFDQLITDRYALYNGDGIEVMCGFPKEIAHASFYSPPFATEDAQCLYQYSSDPRDLSNCLNFKQYGEHYGMFVEQVHRLTMKGRLSAVHCTDISSGNTGRDRLFDFPGEIIRLHEKIGFEFVGRHVIWKEPLWVRNRTMTHNLTHQTIIDDAAYAGLASADYLLMFRKKGRNPIPIEHPTGLMDYAGECPIPEELRKYRGWTGDQKLNLWSHQIWRRYASSIWDDLRPDRVLQYKDCGDPEDEKHVHTTWRDTSERFAVLRTNPGETILTPFAGVGGDIYDAVRLGRKAIAIELKTAYYRQLVANLARVDDDEPEAQQPSFGFELAGLM